MTNRPQLIGGPADGQALPERYANALKIQMPIRDADGAFATYAKDPNDPNRYLFEGFTK